MTERKAKKSTPATQSRLPLAEIRDDCVVLNDGTLRAVLLVSSINFALKSEDEQNAIVASYVSFLNFLDFPMQIVVQSRQLNLENYLVKVKNFEQQQTNDLLKLQMSEYRQYITELVELGNIMTKRFYLVVTYSDASNKKRSFLKRLGDVFTPARITGLNQKQFDRQRKNLSAQVDKTLSGLTSMGLRASVLDTQSLIELFYNTYNPVVAQSQKMDEINKLRLAESAYNI